MKRPRQTIRRYSRPFAIVCFLLVLFAAPLLISISDDHRSGAVYAASSNSYSLSTPVRLMSGPTIDLESGTLSMPPSRTGLARGGQMIAMLITGSGPTLTLEDATFTADFSTREPTISREQATETIGEIAPLVKALQGMQFGSLVVRDSTVRIKMSDGSIVRLDKVDASISGKPNGAVTATGSFDFHGEKVEFDTVLGASLDPQGMSRPISASFKSKPLTATLDGSLMLGESPQLISPQTELAAADLRAAARWLGVNWPSGNGFGAFRAKGPLEWVNRSIAFQNAAIELDENDATGTLSVNFAGPRPAIEATIGLKTLDLTQYLKKRDPAEQPATLLTSLGSADRLEFSLIEAVDADFRISADRVTLPETTIGRSAATVSLRNGKMLADIAELEFDDGTRGGGQMRIDQSGPEPSFGMQVKFETPDVGHAIQAAFGHPTVQGRGSVTIDLTATGNTGAGLLQSLEGKLGVTLSEPGRVGVDINVLTAAQRPTQPGEAVAQAKTWHEVTASAISVDKLDAKFVVTNGVVHVQSADAVSGQRALKAGGAINLIERSLDMQLAVGDAAVQIDNSDAVPPMALQPSEIIGIQGPWAGPAIQNMPAPPTDAQKLGPPAPG